VKRRSGAMLVQRGGIDLGTPSFGGAADQAEESILERGRGPSAGPTRAEPLGPTEGAPRAVAVIEPLDLEFTGAVLA